MPGSAAQFYDNQPIRQPLDEQKPVWIYLADLADFDADGFRQASILLSDAERKRARAFVREQDRNLYCVAHALLRHLLSSQLGIDSARICFKTNDYGKPQLDPGCLKSNSGRYGPGGQVPSFNLSHSGTRVAVCFDPCGLDCGIDIEQSVCFSCDVEALSGSYYSRDEHALIMALPEDCRTQAFLSLWVQKEAILKTSGIGLSGLSQAFLPAPAIAPAKSIIASRDEIGGRLLSRFFYSYDDGVMLSAVFERPLASPPIIKPALLPSHTSALHS